MSGKRDSNLVLSTDEVKESLGFGLDDGQIQSKVLEATPNNNAPNNLSSFSVIVSLTSSESIKVPETLKAVHRVILCDEWRVAFKSLQLLNYLLHYGGDKVSHWVRGHLRSLEEFSRSLDDQHHKRLFQEQLGVIQLLLEDDKQLEKEREDTLHNDWLYKVTRRPPARPYLGYILSNSSLDLPNLTPTSASATRASTSGSFFNSTVPLNLALRSKPLAVSQDMGISLEEGRRRQSQGGMDKAFGFPTADGGGNSRTQRKDFAVTSLDGSRGTHRKMVTVLTLQAIHMLLACQSIIEFLQTNRDKMLFSREKDAELWKVYLGRVSKRGTYSVKQCREELAEYYQDIERDPSEKLNRLASSMLEKAIKEMQDLSLSLENFVKFGGVCIFADHAFGFAFHRLFIKPGKENFNFVDEWEVQIVRGDMKGAEEWDQQFRRAHLDLALAMRKIAEQFIDFAWSLTLGSGSSVKFNELYTSKPLGPRTATLTQTRHKWPIEEPNLTFLTASQNSEYKSRFVALADEGSHVISREKATAAIRRLNIHPSSVAHIWEAVGDVTSSNELYFPEFALALYLGNELREGRSITLKLPLTIKKNVKHHVGLARANIALNISNKWATRYRQKKHGEIPKKGQQDEEEDQPSAAQLSKNDGFETTQVLMPEAKGIEEDRSGMTEGDHPCVFNEAASQLHTQGASSTPTRGNNTGETRRMADTETEISRYRKLQIAIEGTRGEGLEGEGVTEHTEPSLVKNTRGEIHMRNEFPKSETAGTQGRHVKGIDGGKTAHNDLGDRDGALLRPQELKRPREAEQEPRVEADEQLNSEETFVAEEQRKVREEEKRCLEAAAEAELGFEGFFDAEEEAKAEERQQQVAEGKRQLAEAQQKQETELQWQQEDKLDDQEGCDRSTDGKSLDTMGSILMPAEESERHIAANTSEADDLQLVDISPQPRWPKIFDGHEKDSRRQTLIRARETPKPPMADGTATGAQMPQHRQMEILGHRNNRHQTPSLHLKVRRQHTPNSEINRVSSSRIVPDLVRDSKLDADFAPNGQVSHVSYATPPRMGRRLVWKKEIWKRQRELGSGAFGRVWLEKCVTGDDIGKLRAVKEITKLQRQSRTSKVDYNRELEAIAKFSHKKYVHCFVQSFGWFESEEAIFIAMEYLEHGDLQSHLDRPFPEDEVREIVFQLLEGLRFMHENGFAHRDLKPANILVSERSPNWWVKISDFGISKRAEEEEATAFRTVVGTQGYIAPEVNSIFCPEDIATIADLSSLYTVAVDLWALGAIMFKLLTHQTIFAEPLELARYVTGRRPFPRALVSQKGASEACIRFLEEAMAPSPTSRPSSSQALAHEWLADLSNQADSSEEFPDKTSTSTGVSTGPLSTGSFTPVPDESTASAAWPSTFS